MTGHPLTPLCDTLRPHFDLGKTRLVWRDIAGEYARHRTSERG